MVNTTACYLQSTRAIAHRPQVSVSPAHWQPLSTLYLVRLALISAVLYLRGTHTRGHHDSVGMT
jgi:hypothetical protein